MMSHAEGWVGRLNCVTLPENALGGGGGGGLQSCVTEHAHLTMLIHIFCLTVLLHK